MALKGKKVVVVGLGRSGVAAAKLLIEKGAEVWVTDRRSSKELAYEMKELKDWPVRFVLEDHSASIFSGAALTVVSPGVPTASIETGGTPVIGETELAFRYLSAPMIAITGTNGKSTTSALLGHILKTWDKRVFVGGNLGIPLCEAARSKKPWEWIVAEISSFQLETIETFRPRIAVLLNITPNHLDRYPHFRGYICTKLRIFERQTQNDRAVVNFDDEIIRSYLSTIRPGIVGFSRKERPPKGVWLDGDRLISDLGGSREIVRRNKILLRGEHNLENVMAAAAAAQLAGCPEEFIRKALSHFSGLEHRLEVVRVHQGVLYVNDSKATTVSATASALESFEEPVILIAGGQDKGMDFSLLKPVISRKVRDVILIGEAREKIRKALEDDHVPIHEAASLNEAVKAAATLATAGQVVLMAPGCASFDMFRDFEERGQQFKALVSSLA
jgi:UDP-N-acetylmuramoylalanine--D-glutamate ligase